jgi:hypothetical protein
VNIFSPGFLRSKKADAKLTVSVFSFIHSSEFFSDLGVPA